MIQNFNRYFNYFLQRIEMAVSNWKKHGDFSSHPLESKIKCIGGANLIEASQFHNLQELLKEVKKYHTWPVKRLVSAVFFYAKWWLILMFNVNRQAKQPQLVC